MPLGRRPGEFMSKSWPEDARLDVLETYDGEEPVRIKCVFAGVCLAGEHAFEFCKARSGECVVVVVLVVEVVVGCGGGGTQA